MLGSETGAEGENDLLDAFGGDRDDQGANRVEDDVDLVRGALAEVLEGSTHIDEVGRDVFGTYKANILKMTKGGLKNGFHKLFSN